MGFTLHRRALLAAALTVGWAGKVRGQAAAPPDFLAQVQTEGRWLPALGAAERFAMENSGSAATFGWQTVACLRAMIGDELGALTAWRASGTRRPRFTVTDRDLAAVTTGPAMRTIAERARMTRVVILNEAHHRSQCRHFARSLLPVLRKEGFDHFAAETFTPDVRKLEPGQPVSTHMGAYIGDPHYAELARSALVLGMRVSDYESGADQAKIDGDVFARANAREAAQVDNLVALLADRPHTKLFVYCGYDHLQETPAGRITWMAARLRERIGIDPLTIDQTAGLPLLGDDSDGQPYRDLAQRLKLTQPCVVWGEDARALTFDRYQGKVDLAVFHPAIPQIAGRPGWLAHDRSLRRLRVSTLRDRGPRLLQAFYLSETSAAVPADQTLADPVTGAAVLHLRPGRYRLAWETLEGRRDDRYVTVRV
jgi:hypothetical protein